MVIHGLNFSFKLQYLIVSRTINQIFFPTDTFFFKLQMIVYQIALIPGKLTCAKKFLVTQLSVACSCSSTTDILNIPNQSIYFKDSFTFHGRQYQKVVHTYTIL